MSDTTILVGDALAVLKTLPDRSFHCAATSPPYHALRDYQHEGQIGQEKVMACWGWCRGEPCGVCYCCHLTEVFREVRRVLRRDGTFWLNIGYGYKDKQVVGAPWALAFALQADGWLLRQECVWCKMSPNAESTQDRPTKAHEQVFLFARSPDYFYDTDADRPPIAEASRERMRYAFGGAKTEANIEAGIRTRIKGERELGDDRNLWSVWDDISPENVPDAHFATYPTGLPLRCLKLGTSARGVCPTCGAPWTRVVERERVPTRPGKVSKVKGVATAVTGNRDPLRHVTRRTVKGWQQGCSCPPAEPVPARILDPFLGSRTTLVAARRLGLHGTGIELNPDYAAGAEKRVAAALSDLPARREEESLPLFE